MPIDVPAAPAVKYNLEAVLDLRAASGLRQRLMQLLGEGAPLELDASQVKRISTASIQVIAAFVAAARQSGRPLSIKSKSPVFAAAFASLGLDSIISEVQK